MDNLDRFTRAWAVALFLIGAGLCFVPLFNLLGYEFAFALGVPVAFCGGAVGVRARRVRPTVPWTAWCRASATTMCLALIPLLPITINALRVRNCDYVEGLAFYGVLTLTTAIIASGWGVAIGRFAPRRGVWLFCLATLLTLTSTLVGLWYDPPVDAFHPLFGYYPGPIYDAVVEIDLQLLAARIKDVSMAIMVVAFSGVQFGRQSRELVGWLGLCIGISGYIFAEENDVHRDREHIIRRLGGEYETQHARIIYPSTWSADRIERFGWEIEFDYEELRQFFGFDLSREMVVYAYPDLHTKKHLMGAGNTRVAKPWQWAFSVHHPKIGDDVTIHEMAHVFSAEIADAPHHLSLSTSGFPNMALIEGLAVAATWDGRRLDRHQWTRAMRELGLAPSIDTLLAPSGFISSYQGIAYTVCGSFSRHFKDVHGVDALAEAYRTGDFAAVAGRPLAALAKDWEAFVDAQALPAGALAQARASFDRPSIFYRVCARDIADRARRARTALRKHELRKSLDLVNGILEDTPRAVRHRLSKIQLLFLMNRDEDARRLAQTLANDMQAGALARARAQEWLADLDGLDGRLDAKKRYETALSETFDRGVRRRLWVKRAALSQSSDVTRLVLTHLTRPADGKAMGERVDQIVAAAPDWAVGYYLRGRVRLGDTPPVSGLESLMRAQTGELSEELRMETQRLLAGALFRAECYSASAVRYARLATDPRWSRGESANHERWARRARFFGKKAQGEPEACQSLIDIISRHPEDGAGLGNRHGMKPVLPIRPEQKDGDPR